MFDGLPQAYFRCVVIDPPWRWATRSQKGLEGRPQHYDRLSDAEIAALPVKGLLEPQGAWVFVWGTSPKAPFVVSLAEHWGLQFSGRAFLWIKTNKDGSPFTGMGFTTRKNGEDCWLFRHGSPKRNARDVPEVLLSPRREHSRKPVDIMERIERFCDGPRLELFARSERPGWTSWGNETGLFVEDCDGTTDCRAAT